MIKYAFKWDETQQIQNLFANLGVDVQEVFVLAVCHSL